MNSPSGAEHFVTLFDSAYLPMGICLHGSLMRHALPFRLWIICMDDEVLAQLRRLDLPHVNLIPVKEVETDSLLAVRDGRTRVEYCWTMTPFAPQFVFERDASISRVTYLDADLFFFDSPRLIFEEFDASGKDVLITRHAYAPEYDQSEGSGIFCVQFMVFRRAEGGMRVMKWWQDRCLEWCFFRIEPGRLGDQKYLDDWPERFSGEVHVLGQTEKTLAPWNVRHMLDLHPRLRPVFYHFHGLRIVSASSVLLYLGYRVGRGRWIYDRYLEALRPALALMKKNGFAIPVRPPASERFRLASMVGRKLLGKAMHASI
jgi:hypothetical protein